MSQSNFWLRRLFVFLPPAKPTKGLEGLHQLDGEVLPFGQLLQHLGHLIVSTADQAMAVDRLDHVAHVDDLDLVDDAPLTDSLQKYQMNNPNML